MTAAQQVLNGMTESGVGIELDRGKTDVKLARAEDDGRGLATLEPAMNLARNRRQQIERWPVLDIDSSERLIESLRSMRRCIHDQEAVAEPMQLLTQRISERQ